MRRKFISRVFVLLMVVSVVAPDAIGVMAQGGLEGDTSYVSPQFGYTVTWGEDWNARSRDVISNPGGYDTLTLRHDDGNLWIQGQGDTESAVAAVERRITIEGDQEDVVAQNLEGDVPTAEMLVGRNKVLIEGYTLEDTDAVVVIVLSSRERNFDDVLASVHDQILFNESQILTGNDVAETAGGEEPTDLTEAADEAPADPVETPEDVATEEPTGQVDVSDEPTADTPADDVDERQTPEAQLPADDDVDIDEDEATSESAPSRVENGVFTSDLYSFTAEFDEDIWTLENEILNDTSDGIVITNDLGSLTVWSWDAYGADAHACLQGESEYYGSEDPTVDDWEPALDAKGDPLEGEGEGFAWGVFTLTYTNDAGEEIELVDYIECREIPADDAVVIVFASATPDLYNDHLEQVLDVADAIEVEGETTVPGSDEPDQGESGLSGSLFTSPSFGFSVEIPSQWRIDSEQLSSGDESLALSNGVSNVTLWATTAYQGSLAGCVDFAAEESGLDLDLDTNAEGEPFRAEGRREAYAHFIYTGDDGEEMIYFVSCQNIIEGESVLILTQDVPYGEFASQRKFRAELQDAIVMP